MILDCLMLRTVWRPQLGRSRSSATLVRNHGVPFPPCCATRASPTAGDARRAHRHRLRRRAQERHVCDRRSGDGGRRGSARPPGRGARRIQAVERGSWSTRWCCAAISIAPVDPLERHQLRSITLTAPGQGSSFCAGGGAELVDAELAAPGTVPRGSLQCAGARHAVRHGARDGQPRHRRVEHDPEKWTRVFLRAKAKRVLSRRSSAIKRIGGGSEPKKRHPAYGNSNHDRPRFRIRFELAVCAPSGESGHRLTDGRIPQQGPRPEHGSPASSPGWFSRVRRRSSAPSPDRSNRGRSRKSGLGHARQPAQARRCAAQPPLGKILLRISHFTERGQA